VTFTPTDTPLGGIPTETATSTEARAQVIYHNPIRFGDQASFILHLDVPADRVRWTLWTPAYRMVGKGEDGPLPVGDHSLPVETVDSFGRPLANGLYYFVVWVDGKRKGVWSFAVIR